MDSNTTTTIATSRGESLHYHHHNTTWASIEEERKEWERIKVAKNRERRERKETRSVEWQACTNSPIPSLPLKAYPLLRRNNSFGHKPFKPVPSKVDNFYGKIILWGYPRWGSGSLLGLSLVTQLYTANWSFTSFILPLIAIVSSLVFAISPITCSFYLFLINNILLILPNSNVLPLSLFYYIYPP